MTDLDNQADYWNRVGVRKPFGHPVNVDRLQERLSPTSLILDLGCGYGRVLEILSGRGFRNLVGFDHAPAMTAVARRRVPQARVATIRSAHLPLPEGTVDAVLLMAVLTCVPNDTAQRALVREVHRVLRPGGLLYVSDLWIQPDERNQARYRRYQAEHGGRFGVFELDDGAVVRHHDTQWFDTLTADFSRDALDELVVETMNGHHAQGFQWFGRKPITADEKLFDRILSRVPDVPPDPGDELPGPTLRGS